MKSGAMRELTLSVAALGAVLVVTALVGINLVQRVAPALAGVLSQNVQSLDAAGEMLVGLSGARLPEPTASAARRRFAEALDRAARNPTEPGESELVAELSALAPAALDGEPRALERTLIVLERLEAVNRAAVERANAEAQRLGAGGAWALALLGMLGVLVAGFVRRRLYRRVVAPLDELTRVLLAADAGDSLQRCATRGPFARQHRALVSLNRALDAAAERRAQPSGNGRLPPEIVPWLLDATGAPLALLDTRGEVVSTSRSTLELLAGEQGPRLREAMGRVARGLPDDQVTSMRRSESWVLVSVSAA